MENNTQPKWKVKIRSKVAWLAMLPIILLIGDTFDLWNIINMPKSTFVQLFTSIAGLLVTFGVWNDTGSRDEY